jgi:putative cardiolipin synthase
VMRESDYPRGLSGLSLIGALKERRLGAYWGNCTVIADPPEKVIEQSDKSKHAISDLARILTGAQQELLLISPYFVPGSDGTKQLVSIAERGVKIRVLTNSYLATDVSAVHSGYMSYRKRLLIAGIELYELKRKSRSTPSTGKADEKSEDKIGGSHASLHAKSYLVDERSLFIGSLNLDPRSARINTEMGLVLESEPLARRFKDAFSSQTLEHAYRVELRPSDGKMIWRTRENGEEVIFTSEPGVGFFRRIGLFLARILPVEEQL